MTASLVERLGPEGLMPICPYVTERTLKTFPLMATPLAPRHRSELSGSAVVPFLDRNTSLTGESSMAMLDTRGVGAFTLLKRTLKEFSSDDMSTYASALAYRGLFAMFPFLVFLIALLGFLDLQNFFDWLRMQAELALPPVAMEQINPVIDQLQEQQAGLLSFGILVALWTASIGFRSLMNALNKAYDVEEGRPTWKLIILALAYTAGVAVLLLFTAGLMVIGPQAMEWLAGQVGMRELVVVLWTWLRWPVIVLMLMLVVALLYYVAPDVEQEFRFITPGSVLAVLVWILASVAFGVYVQNFADYNATYGSIGAIIVLLLYLYISAAVLLFGAELNAVIEHASVEGKDPGDKQDGWLSRRPALRCERPFYVTVIYFITELFRRDCGAGRRSVGLSGEDRVLQRDRTEKYLAYRGHDHVLRTCQRWRAHLPRGQASPVAALLGRASQHPGTGR